MVQRSKFCVEAPSISRQGSIGSGKSNGTVPLKSLVVLTLQIRAMQAAGLHHVVDVAGGLVTTDGPAQAADSR
jgi:hypothetical protein